MHHHRKIINIYIYIFPSHSFLSHSSLYTHLHCVRMTNTFIAQSRQHCIVATIIPRPPQSSRMAAPQYRRVGTRYWRCHSTINGWPVVTYRRLDVGRAFIRDRGRPPGFSVQIRYESRGRASIRAIM
jgi:hypothetical protein